MTRYRLDPSTKAVGDGTAVLGGSPLRLFRLTPDGAALYRRIAAGESVEPSALTDRLLAGGAIHPVVEPDEPHKHGPGDVTVVIPTHQDEPNRLYGLLRHCTEATTVVFVDDSSDPPLTGVRGASVVRLRHNSGPAAARNAGLRSVQTPLVAFVDSDVDLHDGWLDGLLGHFDDDRVGFVAPRVASGPAAAGADAAVARYEEHHSPLDLGTEPARIEPGTRVSYVPGAVLVARTAAIQQIGGFDTRLRVGEDVDAVWRLVESGHRCRYEPSAVVEHTPRPTWASWLAQRVAYGSSAAPLARRHRGALAPVRTTGWSIAVWLLVSGRRPLAALGLASYTGVALGRMVPGIGGSEAARLVALGHLHAGRLLAMAVRRVWWPFIIGGAVRSRWCRRVLACSVLATAVDRRRVDRIVIGLVDDVAYGVGVWRGVIRWREPGPLLPAITSWPGRATDR